TFPWTGRCVAAIALSAMAAGALSVWLYLRLSSTPQERAAQRIEELQRRLKELADELARYAPTASRPGERAAAEGE
ncbi:MAG: hypothetical protein QHJ73_15090, partial [Armatimonadota bacterium]|nr:hypothetical protein [Armatimonadota bacterium]